MRKILFVMFAALSLAACEKDFQSQTEKTELETVVQNNKVSLKQALLYAENSINGINPTTRSAERKVKSTEIYVAKPATRSAEGAEVSFYLINYEDNEGFAMISTDSRTTPVYAYSDEGSLTAEDFETNPGLQIFMNGAIPNYEDEVANYITYGIGDDRWPIDSPDTLDDPRPIEIDGVWTFINTDTTTMFVDKLLTTEWHQEYPYSAYMSKHHWNGPYPSGCGPTAIAQIMAYYRYPNSHFDVESNKVVYYNWDLMRSNIRTNYGSAPNNATDAISELMYHIGIAAEAYPYDGKTWTYPNKIIEALNEFGYSSSNVVDISYTTIKSQIDANKPVYVTGDKPGGDGHAWVIDGYEFEERIVKYYYAEPPFSLYRTSTGTTKYFHCNWGNPVINEGDLENGFFLATAFIYSEDNQMIYNITPDN